jgi:nucleotide-binding universal stress UspA family protein
MARRVMIPLDRSERAERALSAIPAMCEQGDEIVLLSIAEPEHETQSGVRHGRVIMGSGMGVPAGGAVAGVTRPDMPVYAETSDQAARRQLDELEGYLRPKARALETEGYNVHLAFELGAKPEDAIVEAARKLNPTFILMTRSSRTGIAQRVFGTVAQHVIQADVAPVMLLPER